MRRKRLRVFRLGKIVKVEDVEDDGDNELESTEDQNHAALHAGEAIAEDTCDSQGEHPLHQAASALFQRSILEQLDAALHHVVGNCHVKEAGDIIGDGCQERYLFAEDIGGEGEHHAEDGEPEGGFEGAVINTDLLEALQLLDESDECENQTGEDEENDNQEGDSEGGFHVFRKGNAGVGRGGADAHDAKSEGAED